MLDTNGTNDTIDTMLLLLWMCPFSAKFFAKTTAWGSCHQFRFEKVSTLKIIVRFTVFGGLISIT